MNRKQLAEHIGNIDDRLVAQAEHIPNYAALRRRKWVRQLLATAAVLALMISSFSVGALAFARETVVEVPAEQETVELAKIGVTLILPDSWKGKYEVIEGTFGPYDSPMWEFCVKSIYDAHSSGDTPYRGTLFSVFQYADYSMSAEEFAQSGLAGIGRYLFATEAATYAVIYATDVQFDPENAAQREEWSSMDRTGQDIRFVISAKPEQG